MADTGKVALITLDCGYHSEQFDRVTRDNTEAGTGASPRGRTQTGSKTPRSDSVIPDSTTKPEEGTITQVREVDAAAWFAPNDHSEKPRFA